MGANLPRSLLLLCIILLVSPIGTGAWLWKQPQAVVEEGSESQDSEFIGWQGERCRRLGPAAVCNCQPPGP
jgi:hypothetical protein